MNLRRFTAICRFALLGAAVSALAACPNDLIQNPPGSTEVKLVGSPTETVAANSCDLSWETNVATKFVLEYGTVSGSYSNATVMSRVPRARPIASA